MFHKNFKFSKELLGLDYLVFSSHKTGTQTLVNTLNKNGFKCRHCHALPQVGLEAGSFGQYIESFFSRNKKKLEVINVFRDPMERHMSSFFQWYGTRPLERNEVSCKEDTIIFKESIPDLQVRFIAELQSETLKGLHESLIEMCQELGLDLEDFCYNESGNFWIYENKFVRIRLLRFDVLFARFVEIMSQLAGVEIVKSDSNRSLSKWYKSKYSEFKETLVLPGDLIEGIYSNKRKMIDMFYFQEYDLHFSQVMDRYGVNE